MDDIITIEDLRCTTRIGIHPWEQAIQQTVIFDLQLYTSIKDAADHDALENTIDYAALAAGLEEFVQQSKCQLIETLATRAADHILQNYPISKLQLKLSKPQALPQAKNVAVIIERQKT